MPSVSNPSWLFLSLEKELCFLSASVISIWQVGLKTKRKEKKHERQCPWVLFAPFLASSSLFLPSESMLQALDLELPSLSHFESVNKSWIYYTYKRVVLDSCTYESNYKTFTKIGNLRVFLYLSSCFKKN